MEPSVVKAAKGSSRDPSASSWATSAEVPRTVR